MKKEIGKIKYVEQISYSIIEKKRKLNMISNIKKLKFYNNRIEK